MFDGDNNDKKLEEMFVKKSKQMNRFRVRLSAAGFEISEKLANSMEKQQVIEIENIIGSRLQRQQMRIDRKCRSGSKRLIDDTMDNVDTTDASAYLTIVAYTKHAKSLAKSRVTITLRFRKFDNYRMNREQASEWLERLNWLRTQRNPMLAIGLSKRFLVILNPISGRRQGLRIFREHVSSIFDEAGILYELKISGHRNAARDLIRSQNLTNYQNIVVIGGDGILFEVVNGLFERTDWSTIMSRMAIGIVPSGTGNGVIKSICYHFNEQCNQKNLLGPVLSLVRYRKHTIDVMRVETRSKVMYSTLSIGWGFIADVDIESERLRKLGNNRFVVWTLFRLLTMRSYKGRLWYLPQQNYNKNNFTEIPLNDSKNEPNQLSRLESWYSTKSTTESFRSQTETEYSSTIDAADMKPNPIYGPASTIPSLLSDLKNEPITNNWKLIDDEFLMVYASIESHLSTDCFFTPDSILDQGVIWLMVIHKGLSRNQLLNFLIGMKTGEHIKVIAASNGLIELIACRAFRIEPQTSEGETAGGGGGHLTIDGERIEYGPIQAEVFSKQLHVLVP